MPIHIRVSGRCTNSFKFSISKTEFITLVIESIIVQKKKSQCMLHLQFMNMAIIFDSPVIIFSAG